MNQQRTNICVECGKPKSMNYALRCRRCGSREARRKHFSGATVSYEDRNADIIDAYINQHWTYAKIGEAYGLTRQRVQQIIDRSLPGDKMQFRKGVNSQKLVLSYAASTTIEELASRLGISIEGARHALRRHDLPLLPTEDMHRRRLRNGEIVELYRSGTPVGEIQRRYNLNNPSAVYHILNTAGVTTRQTNRGRPRVAS